MDNRDVRWEQLYTARFCRDGMRNRKHRQTDNQGRCNAISGVEAVWKQRTGQNPGGFLHCGHVMGPPAGRLPNSEAMARRRTSQHRLAFTSFSRGGVREEAAGAPGGSSAWAAPYARRLGAPRPSATMQEGAAPCWADCTTPGTALSTCGGRRRRRRHRRRRWRLRAPVRAPMGRPLAR